MDLKQVLKDRNRFFARELPIKIDEVVD